MDAEFAWAELLEQLSPGRAGRVPAALGFVGPGQSGQCGRSRTIFRVAPQPEAVRQRTHPGPNLAATEFQQSRTGRLRVRIALGHLEDRFGLPMRLRGFE